MRGVQGQSGGGGVVGAVQTDHDVVAGLADGNLVIEIQHAIPDPMQRDRLIDAQRVDVVAVNGRGDRPARWIVVAKEVDVVQLDVHPLQPSRSGRIGSLMGSTRGGCDRSWTSAGRSPSRYRDWLEVRQFLPAGR